MKKEEIIEKYGIEYYNRKLEITRLWHKTNKNYAKEYRDKEKEHISDINKAWYTKNKESINDRKRKTRSSNRDIGITQYCKENFELIENYELAKADNFDANKWHLHHRLENYWSSKTLLKKKLYYNVNPEALIWLPAKEHKIDSALATIHPELSKWHKRILE